MNDATTEIDRPTFGPQGEPCANCGTRLARDQRYCLECGTRRSGMGALLAETPVMRERTVVSERPAPPLAAGPWRLDAGLLAGVGCLLLALLVGVLIGRSGGSDDSTRRAAAPQVVTLGGAAAPTTGTAAAPAAFTSDWPAGKRGFTIELRTLPKSGTDAAAVAAAKLQAAGKGLPGVGALDSDRYGTLDPAQYVIFSGQYADRAAAKAALGKAKTAYPAAKVVEVAEKAAKQAAASKPSKSVDKASGKVKAASAAEQAAGAKAIQDIQNATGKDYSKKSAKLPDKLATPGKLPPKDTSKPAGGGSQTETFK